MAHHEVNGVRLWVEEEGEGPALVFVHEFGGDVTSWRRQIDHFKGRFRCVAYNARGYPPSDVPEDEGAYGQDIAIADLADVLDALGIEAAHLVGLSMGAYTALRFALAQPERTRSLAAASGGSGSYPPARAAFIAETLALSDHVLETGSLDLPRFTAGPARIQLKRKAPEVWQEFTDAFLKNSPLGSALTLRKVQAGRPSLWDFEAALNASTVPTLLLIGDEDEPCIDVNVFLKRAMPHAGLQVFPKSGHLINLEDPAAFNAALDAFHAAVAAGNWPARDPVSRSGSVYFGRDES